MNFWSPIVASSRRCAPDSPRAALVGADAVVGGAIGREAHGHIRVALAGGEAVAHADDEEIGDAGGRLRHLPAADLDADPGAVGIGHLELHRRVAGQRHRLAARAAAVRRGEPGAVDRLRVLEPFQARQDGVALGVEIVARARGRRSGCARGPSRSWRTWWRLQPSGWRSPSTRSAASTGRRRSASDRLAQVARCTCVSAGRGRSGRRSRPASRCAARPAAGARMQRPSAASARHKASAGIDPHQACSLELPLAPSGVPDASDAAEPMRRRNPHHARAAARSRRRRAARSRPGRSSARR